ncbi:2',5' RNA ligase [uncultured delta proteobacterium]|uniref:RNA 2',3'-cyclic phosphodiesterase n=1 Tax=uncultured delta proteobacterium TaxID=34034 RepID=A0A212KCT6_9DELT|nr:2',5' RNA ligase [uncultured delta proteobacterium]
MPDAPGGKTRLFAAVAIPDGVTARMAALRADIPGCRWLTAHHLTLRFIGEVEQDQATAIRASLREVTAAPFSLAVRGLGLFAQSRQTVVWAGLEPSPALFRLKEGIDAALAGGAGLPEPRGRFTPHITLARLKTAPPAALRAHVRENAATGAGAFSVAAFGLYSSILAPGGAVHTLEEAYPLVVSE